MSVTKYVVKILRIEEVEVLTDGDSSALREALNVSETSPGYYHNHLTYRIVKQRTEIIRRESPPVCKMDDGEPCDDPISVYEYGLRQWLCAKHHRQLRATEEQVKLGTEAPIPQEAAPIPEETIF